MNRYFSIILFLGCLICTGSVNAEEYTFDYQKIINVDQPVLLDISHVKGKIEIIGGEPGRLIIEATKQIRASSANEAEEVADHIEIKVRYGGSDVTVQTNYLHFLNRAPSFWRKILGAGSDAYGTVDYVIHLPTATDIKIKSLAGEITLSSIEGAIEIDNETGSVLGEFLFGAVTVRQPTGTIDLQWIEGDIRVRAATSAITVNQVRGALDIATLAGDVKVQTELDSSRDYFVKTSSGSIVFSIPDAASGYLDIQTESGEIITQVPVAISSVSRYQIEGKFGLGGPNINLSSSTGDVTVALF